MSRVPLRLTTLLTFAALPLGLDAASLDDWSWYGTNTLRAEHYANDGDPSNGYYPDSGLQWFDELNVNFSRRVSAFEQIQGSFMGLLNESDYRSPDSGVVVERASLTWEKGDASIPFRLEAGDYFGYLSYRTLQRPLKGAQIELQPRSSGTAQQSLLAFAGYDAPSWREFDANASRYLGASWLVQDRRVGSLGVNFVHNARDADTTAGLGERSQNLLSLLGDLQYRTLGQNLLLEGELGFFNGDTDTAGVAGQGRSDRGWFVQLSGSNSGPFSYRLRHEQYGQFYQPAGGSVASDRRSYEAHGTLRLPEGAHLRGRLTRFTDDLESGNSTDTDTAGLQLGGPVAGLGSGLLDAFVQTAEREDGQVDRRTRALSVDFSGPLSDGWSGRAGASLRSTRDHVTGVGTTRRDLRLGADHGLAFDGWRGLVSPNFTLGNVDGGGSDSLDYGPGVGLALQRGPHSVDLDLGLIARQRDRGDDVLDQRLSGRYAWQHGQHRLGVELDYQGRDLDVPGDASGLRIAATYALDFDRPARSTAAASTARVVDLAPVAGLEIAAIAPGAPLAEVRARVFAAGYAAGTDGPGMVAWEAPLLDGVDLRQRLVVEHEVDSVTRTALIIDFVDPRDTAEAMRQYEQVRRVLLERYGAPANSFDSGEIGTDLVAAINDERVVRLLEWRTPSGWLRFGIPRRLDRGVRMELQHASRFPSPRDTLWSVSLLR